MDQPLLSISILTFNRAQYLAEMLRSLVPQVRRHGGLVEVLVNDNASTDDTAEVVRAYSEEMGGIRYHRNEQNLGVISNYELSLRRSRGTFACLPGDDDIYDDNFLDTAIATIRAIDPDLMVFNRSVWNRDMSECILDRLMPIDTGIVYAGAMNLARMHGLVSNLCFISAVVFRTAPARAVDLSYTLQAQFPYPQLEIYFKAFREGRCAVAPNVVLKHRQFNTLTTGATVASDATISLISASVGWIELFLHLDRIGVVPFTALFETREHDHWLDGTMADFIIPNLKKSVLAGVLNIGHVARVLEAVHRLPAGDIRARLFEFAALAVEWGRLVERLGNLR